MHVGGRKIEARVDIRRNDVRERRLRASELHADISERSLEHVACGNRVRALDGDAPAVVADDFGRRRTERGDGPEDHRDEDRGELEGKVRGRDTPEVDVPPRQERPRGRGNTRHR